MNNPRERGHRTFRDLVPQKLNEVLEHKEEEKQVSKATYWMELGALNQEVMDNVASIYCQVFEVDPEDLNDTPSAEQVHGIVASEVGFYETRMAGSHYPILEVRRIRIDGGGPSGVLVRFRTSSHPRREVFQAAVDGYLGEDHLHLAHPLSKFGLQGIR